MGLGPDMTRVRNFLLQLPKKCGCKDAGSSYLSNSWMPCEALRRDAFT